MSGAALLVQEERLALLLREIKWAEEKAALYRTAFARAGVSHASVTRFSDMARLPFLEYSEEEGADAPFFMLTLPLSGILRLSVLRDTAQCSGRIRCYTQGDVARQVQTAADMLAACGVNRASTALLTGDFDDSRVLDLQYALETIGATVLPCESANRTAAAQLLRAAVPDTVIAWEHDLPALADVMGDLCTNRIITIGTRIAAGNSAKKMAERMGRRHAHIFTLAQMGAWIGYRCAENEGIHLEERLFFAEVIDAAGGSSTEDGAAGELVLTTIAAEAMPVLRYRTGLHVRLARGECACGSTQLRIVEE